MSTTVEFAVPTEPITAVPADLSSARSLHQRLNAALDDLGLSGVLPPRWATPARSGFFFAPHNLTQAARLVDALEHIERTLSEAGIDVRSTAPADPADGPPEGQPVTS
jgi:hypothetical protein